MPQAAQHISFGHICSAAELVQRYFESPPLVLANSLAKIHLVDLAHSHQRSQYRANRRVSLANNQLEHTAKTPQYFHLEHLGETVEFGPQELNPRTV